MSADATAGVVYEVNLDLDAAIRGEYLTWLAAHVEEICALPGFTGAVVFEVTDPPPAPGRANLSVQYRLVDQAALDVYFRDHAPRLRSEGLGRFGARFRASRRVLATLR